MDMLDIKSIFMSLDLPWEWMQGVLSGYDVFWEGKKGHHGNIFTDTLSLYMPLWIIYLPVFLSGILL